MTATASHTQRSEDLRIKAALDLMVQLRRTYGKRRVEGKMLCPMCGAQVKYIVGRRVTLWCETPGCINISGR